MEFPELGKQCSFSECKQLDFLPFNCSGCGKVFCKEHYHSLYHECTAADNPVVREDVTVTKYSCSYEQCSNSSPVEMTCAVCKLHFCLEHRHHGCASTSKSRRKELRIKHEEANRQFQTAKDEADKQVLAKLDRAKQKSGVNKTALKVQLMRLKGKAVGLKNIPTTDRLYFSVVFPLKNPSPSKAVFVAKYWTVGRVIDAMAEACGIPNKNNEANAEKLRLFRRSDGVPVAKEVGVVMEELIKEEVLVDGESVILEYVDTDDLVPLENLNKYQN